MVAQPFRMLTRYPADPDSILRAHMRTHSHLHSSCTVAHTLFWLSEAFRFPSGAQSLAGTALRCTFNEYSVHSMFQANHGCLARP